MWQRHRTLWASIAAGWLLIALAFTLNYYFFSSHYVEIFARPPALLQMLVWEIPYWILWAALAPLVLWLTRRFPLERQNWQRHALAHLAACFTLTVAHRFIYLPLCWFLYVDAYARRQSLLALYDSDLLFNLPVGFMCYGTFLLVSSVTDYYERYQAGELRASQLEAQLAQAQLQALKMQLQPHFLFNTLNSISALQLTDVEAANRMTARLGDFLRLTLDNAGQHEVTLRQEMEFLRGYLEIESIRFQDRLQVTLDIEPEALDARVPNLILQPIVENAIKYAIVLRAAAGHIQIRAACIDSRLRLQVQDDGPGLQLPPRGNIASRGVGLTNTEGRLKQLYGNAHKFELLNVPEGGLMVTLELPLKRDE